MGKTRKIIKSSKSRKNLRNRKTRCNSLKGGIAKRFVHLLDPSKARYLLMDVMTLFKISLNKLNNKTNYDTVTRYNSWNGPVIDRPFPEISAISAIHYFANSKSISCMSEPNCKTFKLKLYTDIEKSVRATLIKNIDLIQTRTIVVHFNDYESDESGRFNQFTDLEITPKNDFLALYTKIMERTNNPKLKKECNEIIKYLQNDDYDGLKIYLGIYAPQ